MEVYSSDGSDTDSREQKSMDYGRLKLDTETIDENILQLSKSEKAYNEIDTILLNHNCMSAIPMSIVKFTNLHTLDVSSNNLRTLPDALCQLPLRTLVAKNNFLTNDSLPKTFVYGKTSSDGVNQLRELNLSGNQFTQFPEHVIELKGLKYLYLGANRITTISKDIWKLTNLQILSMGGNLLTDVPETVGNLNQLQALILCDNQIEHLPTSIAKLKNLKSLLLHRNKLKHLPRDIISLQNLDELSLRDNPLVVSFVRDISLKPPSLHELAARAVRIANIPYGPNDLPHTLIDYLTTAHYCVNPKCKGVFFDNRIEHIKFVDFCGKYRVPLLQYLCSSKCIEPANQSNEEAQAGASGYMMRKVLLG